LALASARSTLIHSNYGSLELIIGNSVTATRCYSIGPWRWCKMKYRRTPRATSSGRQGGRARCSPRGHHCGDICVDAIQAHSLSVLVAFTLDRFSRRAGGAPASLRQVPPSCSRILRNREASKRKRSLDSKPLKVREPITYYGERLTRSEAQPSDAQRLLAGG